MPRYKVKDGTLDHDKERYEIGDEVTLTEKQAAPIMHMLESADEAGSRAPAGRSTDGNVEEASAKIAGMTDVKEIRKFIKGDERKGVNDAAEARIEALK